MQRDPPAGGDADVPLEERRWLHDKYQSLAEYEARLADYRTSYFAVLNTALVAGMVLVVINLLRNPPVFAATATLLGLLGIGMSLLWAIVLHRTIAAQNLWRDAAMSLESDFPPVGRRLPSTVPGGRGSERIPVDLSRPYHTHRARFSRGPGAGYFDTVQPAELWSSVPVLFAVAWGAGLAVVWTWYALFGLG